MRWAVRVLLLAMGLFGPAVGVVGPPNAQTPDQGPTVRQDYYGAIAYSASTGGYGTSFGNATRKEAEAEALEGCSKHGEGCQVAVWVENGCAALAADDQAGWGEWADDLETAKSKALAACNRESNKCNLVVSDCTAR